METASSHERFRFGIIIGDMDRERQALAGGGPADGHRRLRMRGRQVPRHDQQRDFICVTALQRAPDGIELVTQPLNGHPNPFFRLLTDPFRGTRVIQNVRDSRL